MREAAIEKRLLLERIERQRGDLRRDLRDLKDGFGWSGLLAGSALSLVGRRPWRWRTWARIIAWLPAVSRVARFFFRRRRKKT